MRSWYNAEERSQYVQQFLTSGLTLQKFSDQYNLKKSTLASWVQNYNNATLALSTNFQDVTPIIKQSVEVNGFYNDKDIHKVKVTTPNGYILEFDSNIISIILKELK